jgi:mono/diheme cytochrome c family protein
MRNIVVAVVLASGSAAFAAQPPVSKELVEKGKSLFNTNCAACHGPKGAGDGPAAVALNPKPRNYATDTFKNGDKPENVFKTISEGLTGTPMVSFAHLPEEDRWALAYYVLELRNAGKPAPAAAAPAPDVKKDVAKKEAKKEAPPAKK